MSRSEQLTNFHVSARVDSSTTTDISQLDDKTSAPAHIIEVENTTSVRRHAQVHALLPNGQNYLAFNEGQGQVDRWSREIHDILVNQIRTVQCPLEHVAPSSANQPIRCQDIKTSRGNSSYISDKTSKVPFDIYISVK